MTDDALSPEAQVAIRGRAELFRAYLGTAEFSSHIEEFEKRTEYFQRVLPSHVGVMGEKELAAMLTPLWAYERWPNKRVLAERILSANTIEGLRREIAKLLDVSRPVAERYDSFVKNVKMLGPAFVSEVLCYREPDKCGIWNGKAKEALETLGLQKYAGTGPQRPTGQDYEAFNGALKTVAKELSGMGLEVPDLYCVNLFLYTVEGGV